MLSHAVSGAEAQQRVSFLWSHIYNKFPNVTHITTPFWPQYSRTRIHEQLVHSPTDKTFLLSLLSEDERRHLHDLETILTNGFVGAPDPSFREARNYLELTHQAYDEHAADYQAAVIQHSPLEEALNEFAKLSNSHGTIIDVGCGPGHDIQRFLERGKHVIGIDTSPAMVKLSKDSTHVPVYQMDMLSLDPSQFSYVHESISGIWCVATLLHLWRSDVPLALHNFYRLLQPSGYLFLSVKQGSGSKLIRREKTGSASRFFTYFALEELGHYLKTVGFEMYSVSQYATYRTNIGWDVWVNMLVRKPDTLIHKHCSFLPCLPQKSID
jgi:SAM-dependent methyltransferase